MTTSLQTFTGPLQRTQPTYRMRRLILRLLGMIALLVWIFLLGQLFA